MAFEIHLQTNKFLQLCHPVWVSKTAIKTTQIYQYRCGLRALTSALSDHPNKGRENAGFFCTPARWPSVTNSKSDWLKH